MKKKADKIIFVSYILLLLMYICIISFGTLPVYLLNILFGVISLAGAVYYFKNWKKQHQLPDLIGMVLFLMAAMYIAGYAIKEFLI